MKKSRLLLTCGALLAFLLSSCLKDEVDVRRYIYTDEEFQVLNQHLSLPDADIDYQVALPSYMKSMGMAEPSINNSKAVLGRVLFYDTKLSKTKTVSCASCHDQSIAFSDDTAFSEGFDGGLTKRNSLALASVANFESSYGGGGSFNFGNQALFFWDERAHSIAEQSTMSITDAIEMGMSMDEVTERLKDVEYYPILFNRAFGSPAVTPNRITNALQEFVNSFVSVQSKFDEGMNSVGGNMHVPFNNFTASENRGKSLFTANCQSCHGDMATAAENVANNGLDLVYEDGGVGDLTGNDTQNGTFKVPFLRNIALTGPYMHDGRFETLEEVVEHYSSGIKNHDFLDHRLRHWDSGAVRHMNFSDQDKADLVAFLKTLTDNTFIADERYSDPFK